MYLKLNQACIKAGRMGWLCRRIPMNQSNQRSHWSVKYKWTKAWKEQVEAAYLEQVGNLMPRPKYEKSKVVITFYACRFMDRDGAYHAAKPVIDGLIDSQIIVDDSTEHIDLEVKQEKSETRLNEVVTIEITPIA